MKEREPTKETISQGELFFLWHPGNDPLFSGYGLTVRPDSNEFLVGLLMVDRPRPVNPSWLREVEEVFGSVQLVPMSQSGDRGILCQMQIEPDSQQHLRCSAMDNSLAIQKALEPLLTHPPAPMLSLRWDEGRGVWASRMVTPMELPLELRQVFEHTGYGCITSETNIGVVHVCHASDADIEGFRDKPAWYQWQLIQMPTAPLIRFEAFIMDNLDSPFRFESFLNVAEEDQARILAQLANQEKLYLTFYGERLDYHFTKVLTHSPQQWQQLDELTEKASQYWNELSPAQRDFDLAKAEFMRNHA